MKLDILTDKIQESRLRFTTTTSHGLYVELSTLGAGIQKIALSSPSSPSPCLPVSLSYPDDSRLLSSGSYAGRTLAPNAGRIRASLLRLAGQCVPLHPNEGEHQLHGGEHNLSLSDWSVTRIREALDYVEVVFEAFQPDGLDGYPGNRRYEVRYRIEDTNWILIQYKAFSDRPSYINMSNHSYWNLRGISENPDAERKHCSRCSTVSGSINHPSVEEDALLQELEISANTVVLNDSFNVPYDIIPVSGTVFDFRTPASLSHKLHSDILRDVVSDRQFSIGRGFNNAFILTRPELRRRLRGIQHEKALKKACILRDPASGRQLTLMTDAPALVLYSGGHLSPPSTAIALEAQDIPDIGNLMPEQMTLTTPEQPFRREIRFHIV